MITRRVTFRLYPSKSQSAKLFEARRLHAYLYNACVEHRKTSYQKSGKSVGYFDQQAAIVPFKECWLEYKSLNHGSLQATVKRVDLAFQRFFKGLGGYPKFRCIRQYSGWTYPDARQGFKVHSIGEKCNYSGDREVVAAEVMLSWAVGTFVLNYGEESSTEKPTVKSCGGFQQFSSTKRQKLQSSALADWSSSSCLYEFFIQDYCKKWQLAKHLSVIGYYHYLLSSVFG